MKKLILLAVSLNLFHGYDTYAIVTSDSIGTHRVRSGDLPYGLNLDGVAILGGFKPTGEPAGTCTGTLISDEHVLTAAHCFDSNGDGVVDPLLSLFPSAAVFEINGDWVSVDYDLDNVLWPDQWENLGADIAVLTLKQDAPQSIPRYSLYAGESEVGRAFVLAGFGHAGIGVKGEDPDFDSTPVKRAGLNRYEAVFSEQEGVDFLVYDFDSGRDENNSLAITGFTSDLGFGADEVFSSNRDSGGPGFLDGAIASVVAFGDRLPGTDVTDKLDSSWGEAGFDTRVSSYRDFISWATHGDAVFVPEPTSSFHFLCAAVCLLRLRSSRAAVRWRLMRTNSS